MKTTSFASICAAIFLLLTTVAFAQVVINPNNPQDSNDLTCSLQTGNPSAYIYKWYLDSAEKASGTSLSNSLTNSNDVWTCKVFIPPTRYTGITQIGEASVTIQSVQNTAPTANFTSDSPKNEGAQVSFTDASTDLDGTIVSRSWNFGDSTTSNLQNPTHTYSNNGVYNVALTVTDEKGATGLTIRSVTINDLSPLVNFSYSPINIDEGVTVYFTDLTVSYDPIDSYYWRLGGGATSTSNNPGRMYNNGTYVVNLTITDDDYSVSSAAKIIVVNEVRPIANFTASSYVVAANQTVSYTDFSASFDPIATWIWNFGDSQGSSLQNPIHKYKTPGNYSVFFNVTDSDGSGCFPCMTKNIEVKNPTLYGTINDTETGAPVSGANISFYSNSYCSLDDVSLTGSCTTINLPPKAVPDTVTDSSGHYSVYLVPGTYHMVVQHSKQVEYDLIVNSTPKTHNTEINERINAQDYNFEGHIVYGGQYRNGNKYIVGDELTFVMFGITKPSSTPVTVTYAVERHIQSLGDSGSNGALVLNGSFANPSQTLYVPGNNTKVNKLFSFIIPPALSAPGRYDIHVLVDDSGLQKWHKIGNFFIMDNVTNLTRGPPALYFRDNMANFIAFNESINLRWYVNQTLNTTLQVRIPPQDGTIAGVLAASESDGSSSPVPCIFNSTGAGDELIIDAPNALIQLNGETRQNQFRINVTNARLYYCYFVPNFVYADSNHFKINVSVRERYYKVVSQLKTINTTIWATEQQMRDIWYDITQMNVSGLRPAGKNANFTGFYNKNHCVVGQDLGGYCFDYMSSPAIGASDHLLAGNVTFNSTLHTHFRINLDYWYYDAYFDKGFEYRSNQDGYDLGGFTWTGTPDQSQQSCYGPEANSVGATSCERDGLNKMNRNTNPRILVLDPATKKDGAKKMVGFLTQICSYIDGCVP